MFEFMHEFTEDDLERIEVLDGKARKNSIYGQMIRTAPRDMYLCLYAVEDLLHRLCVMYEEADGSEEQLQNLKNRIGEYRNLKLRLRSQIEEYEKP